jgi:hypothetical protein
MSRLRLNLQSFAIVRRGRTTANVPGYLLAPPIDGSGTAAGRAASPALGELDRVLLGFPETLLDPIQYLNLSLHIPHLCLIAFVGGLRAFARQILQLSHQCTFTVCDVIHLAFAQHS